MPLAFLNRCAFVPSAYSDTDDFAVNGSAPVTGFYDPADSIKPSVADGATYRYFAESSDKTQHEEGDGTWDAGTSTLARTTIRNSSNSGAKVNFSAAPTVYMGGPCANDMSGEELLGYVDFAMSGPATVVTLDADLRNLFSLTVIMRDLRQDTAVLDHTDSHLAIQPQFYDADSNPLAAVDASEFSTGHAGFQTSTVEEAVGFEKSLFVWSNCDYSSLASMTLSYIIGGVVTGGTSNAMSTPYGDFQTLATPVTFKLESVYYNGNTPAYDTPQNIISGKIWFYGRRK